MLLFTHKLHQNRSSLTLVVFLSIKSGSFLHFIEMIFLDHFYGHFSSGPSRAEVRARAGPKCVSGRAGLKISARFPSMTCVQGVLKDVCT